MNLDHVSAFTAAMQAQGSRNHAQSYGWRCRPQRTPYCPSLSQDRLPAAGHELRHLISAEIAQNGKTYLLLNRTGIRRNRRQRIGLALTASRFAGQTVKAKLPSVSQLISGGRSLL